MMKWGFLGLVVVTLLPSTLLSKEPDDKHMVAAAHPLAARAGADMLAAGGSAVDAAIAVQMVLTVVEPQSSGIGGGAFMMYWDAETQKVRSYDGRETAPADIKPDIFLDENGKALPFFDAAKGARSVGVPGLVAMLEMSHKAHGKLPWKELFLPAISVARDGFVLSPKLHKAISRVPYLKDFEATAGVYLQKDNTPKQVGEKIRNEALARTLEKIAAGGAKAFYEGDIAKAIVDAVNNSPINPSVMTLKDFADYRAKEREAVCGNYHDYKVCGMGPPSSGGITLLQMLGMLKHFDLKGMAPLEPKTIHIVAEASRLAFADRNKYIADTDFEDVPVKQMLDEVYLKSRADYINEHQVLDMVSAGEFSVDVVSYEGYEPPSTTHFSVVDQWGNAVSMTSSIEYVFGSAMSVGGFLLNNELTDFSFRPEVAGVKVANRVEGGKRPRSSMTPTLVFDKEGKLLLVIGSPGGSRIIGYVLQALLDILDWGVPVEHALRNPHYLSRGSSLELEAGTGLYNVREELEGFGHKVKMTKMNSGLHAIKIHPDGRLEGGVDIRGEGAVLGE
jgi:gamma-glutamyltranspeptidase/glutathione hydrolase